MGDSVNLRLALAMLMLATASAVIAADDPTQRVMLDPVKKSAAVTGTVTGYRSLRYLLDCPRRTGAVDFLHAFEKDSLLQRSAGLAPAA